MLQHLIFPFADQELDIHGLELVAIDKKAEEVEIAWLRDLAPPTEEEREPHEPETDNEDGIDIDVLRQHARRMQRVLEWHQNLLDIAQSRGEFDDVDRIERDIDYVEGLLAALPAPWS